MFANRWAGWLSLVVAVVVGAGALGFFVPDRARAYPTRYLIQRQAPWTWSFASWVIGNDGVPGTPSPRVYCNALGSWNTEVNGAFSDWETALSWTQFSNNCYGYTIYLAWTSDPGTTCGNALAWACVIADWQWDATRQGGYLNGAIIYFAQTIPGGWNSSRMNYTARHEIGHVIGFDEWYISLTQCNGYPPVTVMDGPGCDGALVTSTDKSDSNNSFFGFTAVPNLVGSDCSSYYGVTTFCVNWYDNEEANAEPIWTSGSVTIFPRVQATPILVQTPIGLVPGGITRTTAPARRCPLGGPGTTGRE